MERKKTLKERMWDAKEDFKCWVYNNQDDLYKAAYVTASIAAVVAPVVAKMVKSKRKERMYQADHTVWDPKLGMFWETKKLTNNKKLIIAERRAAGEPLGKILKDMKLLK